MTDRYSRHRAIAGFSQEHLQASRVVVAGAGAIGNEVVKNLCLLGVGRIDLYDFDTVEVHNLTRSVLLREADIGQPKAQAVARRASELDPAVVVRAVPGDLHDTLGPLDLRSATVVIGALDNFEARIRLNLLCWLTGTDWVNAAIDHRHASVEAFPFRSALQGIISRTRRDAGARVSADPGHDVDEPAAPACYECGLPASVYERLAERRSCGGLARIAREQRIMPTTAITASVAAAIAVQMALTMPPTSRRWLLDTHAGLASTATIASNAADGACPVCGRAPAVTIGRIETEEEDGPTRPDTTATRLSRAATQMGAKTIELAEPIVWHAECMTCGETEATRAIVGQTARLVNESASFCFGCGEESVRVELRDIVDAASLRWTLGDRALGLAFARIGPHLIDLTSGVHPS